MGCKFSDCGYGDLYSNLAKAEIYCENESEKSYFDNFPQGCYPSQGLSTRHLPYKSKCLFSAPIEPILNFSYDLYLCVVERKKE